MSLNLSDDEQPIGEGRPLIYDEMRAVRERQKRERERAKVVEESQGSEARQSMSNDPRKKKALNAQRSVTEAASDSEACGDAQPAKANTNTSLVNLASGAVILSNSIICQQDENADIREQFKKHLSRHAMLIAIISEKVGIDFSERKYRAIGAEASRLASLMVAQTVGLKTEVLRERFAAMLDLMVEAVGNPVQDDAIPPMLPVRAKTAQVEALVRCHESVSGFPMVDDEQAATITLFTVAIDVTKDIASNWEGFEDPMERQQLYVTILPTVAETVGNQWKRYVVESLDSDHKPISSTRDAVEDRVARIFVDKGCWPEVASLVASRIVARSMEIMERYAAPYRHVRDGYLSRVKRTLVGRIVPVLEDVAAQTDESDLSSINSPESRDDAIEDVLHRVEVGIDSSNIDVRVDKSLFYDYAKGQIVNLWGASRAIFKNSVD